MLAQTFESETEHGVDLGSKMSEYYHIISKEETGILFTKLDLVFKRVFELEVHTKKLRKKIAKRGGKGSTQRGFNNLSQLSINLDKDTMLMTSEDLLGQSASKNDP